MENRIVHIAFSLEDRMMVRLFQSLGLLGSDMVHRLCDLLTEFSILGDGCLVRCSFVQLWHLVILGKKFMALSLGFKKYPSYINRESTKRGGA